MNEPFLAEIQNFERNDAVNPPPRNAVLFLGSSTIRMWKNLQESFPSVRVINRGFGGSTIADSIQYAGRIVIPCKPRLIIFYAGDNDLCFGKTPEQVFEDFQKLVCIIRGNLPETFMNFISIKPSPSRMHLMEKIMEANYLICEFIRHDMQLKYIDVFPRMLNTDGLPRPELFGPDGLHMSAAGYAVWQKEIQPFLE